MQIFRSKGIEVLLLSDRVDEWLVSHLNEFDGKSLASIAKGELDLDKLADEKEKEVAKKNEDEYADLVKRMKDALSERVNDVRVSQRLTDSPSCLVMGEDDMAVHMQQMLKQAGHEVPTSKPDLEINPAHPLISRLKDESEDARFASWSNVLLDQAMLSEGGQLEDPVAFVNRLNDLLQEIV